MPYNNKRMTILFSWTAVLLWMLLIFYLSSQAADQSDKLSSGLVTRFFDLLEYILPALNIDIAVFDKIARKTAHFSIYLILGILVSDALKRSGNKGWRLITIALCICVLYAISDEVHQLFVPGRSGQAMDVLIDSVGAALGISLKILFNQNRAV